MRYLLLVCLSAIFLQTGLNAQITSITIEVDQTFSEPLPDADLTGYTVYSVYANFTNSQDFLSAIFGIFNEPEDIVLSFDCACFNSDFAGLTGAENNSNFWPIAPSSEFDSYITIGQESTQDPGQTQFISSQPPTAVAVNSFENDCLMNVDDGAFFTTFPQPNGFAGADLKVKIAQFTTCGNFCFSFGVQMFINGNQFDEDRSMWSVCSDLCAINPVDDSISILQDFSCNGDQAIIGLGAGGNGTITYELYDDNGGFPVLIDTQEDNSEFTVNDSGEYFAVLTDIAGCTSTTPIISLDEPAPFEVEVTSFVDLLCANDQNAEVCILASGGTGPYLITAELPDNTSTNLSNPGCVSNLACDGNNNIVLFNAIDSEGCTTQVQQTISCPSAILIEMIPSDLLCNGISEGELQIQVTGGTGPYDASVTGPGLNIELNDFNFSIGFDGLGTGTFNVEITDDNGCIAAASAPVDEPTAINITSSAENLDCSDSCNGTAVISASGGTAPYTTTILQNNVPVSNGNLCAGDYLVQITDGNDCVATEILSVDAPDAIVANTLPADSICIVDCTGVLCAAVLSGGTGDFEYSIPNQAGPQSDPCFGDLCVDNYTIVIEDENGCSVSVNGFIPDVTDIDHPLYVICNPELIFPNVFSPNGDDINEFFFIDGLDAYPNSSIQIFNRWGNIVFESDNYKNNWDAKDATEGTYFFTFKAERYGEEKGTITILR